MENSERFLKNFTWDMTPNSTNHEESRQNKEKCFTYHDEFLDESDEYWDNYWDELWQIVTNLEIEFIVILGAGLHNLECYIFVNHQQWFFCQSPHESRVHCASKNLFSLNNVQLKVFQA